MRVSDKEQIKKGIEAYKHRQNIILRIVRKHKELHQDEFDNIFSDYRTTVENGAFYHKSRRLYLEALTRDTYILGGLLQGEYSKWLHLTQLMIMIGLIKTKMKNKKVVYYLP